MRKDFDQSGWKVMPGTYEDGRCIKIIPRNRNDARYVLVYTPNEHIAPLEHPQSRISDTGKWYDAPGAGIAEIIVRALNGDYYMGLGPKEAIE